MCIRLLISKVSGAKKLKRNQRKLKLTQKLSGRREERKDGILARVGREITEDERNNLRNSGIADKFIDQSILDYPDIAKWMFSDKGEQFLRGEKGLVLNGGWEAVKIGILIERWFILSKEYGAVISLRELLEELKLRGDKEIGEWDPRVSATSMFVKRFQTDLDCPFSLADMFLICDFIENRTLSDDLYSLDILHISDKSLHWYPYDFKDFINDCFVWLEV